MFKHIHCTSQVDPTKGANRIYYELQHGRRQVSVFFQPLFVHSDNASKLQKLIGPRRAPPGSIAALDEIFKGRRQQIFSILSCLGSAPMNNVSTSVGGTMLLLLREQNIFAQCASINFAQINFISVFLINDHREAFRVTTM